MNPVRLIATLATLVAVALTSSAAADPFQRSFKLKNSLPITIYPVIQGPQNLPGKDPVTGALNTGTNCATGGLLRIIVNNGAQDRGLPTGETVTVTLPKSQPCTNNHGPFYDAARIYISVAPIKPYEKLLNADQVTQPIPWDYGKDPLCEFCWIGSAKGDYGLDGPQQLIEYTIISQNPADGSGFDDPNNVNGVPFVDFDVSYVDHTYLPVAMSVDDGGATQFMGSTLDYTTFVDRSRDFMASPSANWTPFGTFQPAQWATKAQCPTDTGPPTSITPTSFSCMVGTRTDRIPSAAGITTSINGTSQYYWPVFGPKDPPPQCGAAANLQCSTPKADGGSGLDPNTLCCPNPAGQTVGCCAKQNFIIADTTYWWHTKDSFGYKNKTVDGTATADGLVQRFTHWSENADLCAAGSQELTEPPVKDKAAFCRDFKNTVDYVWSVFVPQCQKFKGTAQDRCITTAIIAYDLKASGFDPEACKKVCPGPNCPGSCVAEKLRTESVQALQRGVPWGAFGSPALCKGCPSEDTGKCPAACIYPTTPEPDAQATVWHYDGFLHFWPNYSSPYSLNPFARFVHNEKSPDNKDLGLSAPGSYSFSIDDFYGNFGGRGSGLIIEVGGTSTMPNPEPYNPYKQYHASFGSGWDHVEVCGRKYAPPASSPRTPLSVPVSFWNNGQRLSECLVKVFKNADESDNYAVFQLFEKDYQIVDTYSGVAHDAQSLVGVYAFRGGSDPIPVDKYCSDNSKGLPAASVCTGNITYAGDNVAYVAVSNAGCTNDQPLNVPCGKPLINLAVPSLVQ
jgi:hypothetical protein